MWIQFLIGPLLYVKLLHYPSPDAKLRSDWSSVLQPIYLCLPETDLQQFNSFSPNVRKSVVSLANLHRWLRQTLQLPSLAPTVLISYKFHYPSKEWFQCRLNWQGEKNEESVESFSKVHTRGDNDPSQHRRNKSN